MITADYQTLQTYPFTVSVTYIINYASKVGRIAKKFADAKFSYNVGFCNKYHATYAFKSAEVAALCKTALEAANEMVKELEEKLASKEDELSKLNKEFAKINNKQTVKEEPEAKYSSTDVMKELFHPKKNKEE